MEPVTTTLVAGTIAKLAFDEFVKAGAGEVAKKTVAGTVELVKGLANQIRSHWQGQNNERATKAIAELEQTGSAEALTKVEKYLDLEMAEDEAFAATVRQMAQQIINIQTQNQPDQRVYNQTAGRDVINIETVGDNAKIGGS